MTFDLTHILSFDLETTGLNPRTAKIVTSALVGIRGREVTPRELLADPGCPIPEAAQKVHGITTEYAQQHGRPHQDVVAETVSTIRSCWDNGGSLIVFNAAYDLSVLRALDPDFTVTGLVYDPYVIDRIKDPDRPGKRRLGDLCDHYRVTLDQAHQATSDALAAARIAWRQVQVWPELATMDADDLMEMQAVGYYDAQQALKKRLEEWGRDVGSMNFSWPMQG